MRTEHVKVAVPLEFKEIYGKNVCITRGLESTLTIYSKEDFSRISEKIMELSAGEPGPVRLVLSGVKETMVSEDGELLIPDFFIDYTGGDGEWNFIRFADGIRLSKNS